MRPDEYESLPEHNSRRGGRFELFYYERVDSSVGSRVGSRYYLRFTRLALILVVCLTVIPCVAILTLYYKQSRARPEDVNINIRVAPRAPDINPQLIRPAPPATPPPKVGIIPGVGEPARQTPTAPTKNANAPPTPSPTPSPAPPRTPS